VICLHSFISLVFSVIDFHLLYNFFCPPIVQSINWITARFLLACPYSYSFLNAPKALLTVL
jgi:hypothetical protein